jgi:hypothetical protein
VRASVSSRMGPLTQACRTFTGFLADAKIIWHIVIETPIPYDYALGRRVNNPDEQVLAEVRTAKNWWPLRSGGVNVTSMHPAAAAA